MDDEQKFPYIMHKRTLIHVPNTKEARDKFGDEFVPITKEQADALSNDRAKAGVEIMRSVVAADNAAALAEAQARFAPPAGEPRPVEAPPAPVPPPPAPDPAPATASAAAVQTPPAWGAAKKAK